MSMKILTVEFDKWDTILLRLNWLAIIILVALILIVFVLRNRHLNRMSMDVSGFNLGLGSSSITFSYNKKDQEIAYKLWVELSTRKIGLLFDEKHDVIVEVYKSWYEFFGIARNLLKEIPVSRLPYSNDLIELTEKVLNVGLRPHLTTWQAKFRKWYENELTNNSQNTPQETQRKYQQYDELIDDLIKTNKHMVEYTRLMKTIAFRKKENK